MGSWNTTPMLRRSEASVMSRMSIPSMMMRPSVGIEHAMQQAERRRFARAGRADERDGLAGPRREGDVAQREAGARHRRSSHARRRRRPRGGRCRSRPGGRRRRAACREWRRIRRSCGASRNSTLTKPTICSSRPISMVAKLMKATISPMVARPCRCSQVPSRKMTSSVSVAEARSPPPPAPTRRAPAICAASSASMMRRIARDLARRRG